MRTLSVGELCITSGLILIVRHNRRMQRLASLRPVRQLRFKSKVRSVCHRIGVWYFNHARTNRFGYYRFDNVAASVVDVNLLAEPNPNTSKKAVLRPPFLMSGSRGNDLVKRQILLDETGPEEQVL